MHNDIISHQIMLKIIIFLNLLIFISTVEANKKQEWSFFDEWWTWFSYNFKWSDEFTHFNPNLCNVTGTYFFGGSRMRNWVMGSWTWSLIGDTKDHIKDKLNLDQIEHDALGYVPDAGRKRTAREKYLPLMIGRDYHEPCIWQDKAPKIIDYKISAPQDSPLSRGAFDMYIGRGKQDCGEGRFGKLGPRPESGTPAAEKWDTDFKEAQKKSNLDQYQFGWQPDSRNPPMASYNSGGFIGKPGDNLYSKGSFYTSAIFTPSIVDQTVCLIFYCHNQYAACVVAVEHFIVSDIAGLADELPNGTVFWNMTPMDLFALFMTVFSLVFFCIQCCCCCQIFSLELKGGITDQQKVLEEDIMRQAERNRANQFQRKRPDLGRRTPRRATRARTPRYK